jgi:hypothetical protein
MIMSLEFCYEHDSYYDTDFHEACEECLKAESAKSFREILREAIDRDNDFAESFRKRSVIYDAIRQSREAADLDTASESEVFCLSRRYLCELHDHNPGGARMGIASGMRWA